MFIVQATGRQLRRQKFYNVVNSSHPPTVTGAARLKKIRGINDKNFLFSSLEKKQNKLECLSLAIISCLGHSRAQVPYSQHFIFFVTYEWTQ
jgi:hypothetical protein